jgi:predicted permease
VQVRTTLLLRATLAPLVMVLLARLLGWRGPQATALVILALLPVAQTAFVVAQQYDAAGAQVVSSAMLVSLLLMLPQLLVALGLLQWSGVLA